MLDSSKSLNPRSYTLLANNIEKSTEEGIALPKKITVDPNYLWSGGSGTESGAVSNHSQLVVPS